MCASRLGLDIMSWPLLLKSDGFLSLVDLRPVSGNDSTRGFCQNGLTEGFPPGFSSDTMVGCTATEGAHYAPVHLFAQAYSQLAARAAADVSPSSSPGLLLVDCLPGDLPGQGDHQ